MKALSYEVFTKIVIMQLVIICVISVAGVFYLTALLKKWQSNREWKTNRDKYPKATKRN